MKVFNLKLLLLWFLMVGTFACVITACSNVYTLGPQAVILTPTPTSTIRITGTITGTITHTFTPTNTVTITFTPTLSFTPNVSGCVGTNGGNVTTYAGTGLTGSTNGSALSSTFYYNSGLAEDASGNIYVSDENNNLIRFISSAGVVSTYAGSGSIGSANGTGAASSFYYPLGLALDSSGNLYVADQYNNMIRKIAPGGVVTTLAGSGVAGFTNGTGTAASFNKPTGVVVDGAGNVYVAENNNHAIRKITPAGVVTTVAGTGSPGSANGVGTAASFNWPMALAIDSLSNLYVADFYNNMIRKITPSGIVSTLAGNGTAGLVNGPAGSAEFNQPGAVAVDGAGNVYVGDVSNYVVRLISGGIVSTFAGSGVSGSANGHGTSAQFTNIWGLIIDNNCRIFIGDTLNSKVREIQ